MGPHGFSSSCVGLQLQIDSLKLMIMFVPIIIAQPTQVTFIIESKLTSREAVNL